MDEYHKCLKFRQLCRRISFVTMNFMNCQEHFCHHFKMFIQPYRWRSRWNRMTIMVCRLGRQLYFVGIFQGVSLIDWTLFLIAWDIWWVHFYYFARFGTSSSSDKDLKIPSYRHLAFHFSNVWWCTKICITSLEVRK